MARSGVYPQELRERAVRMVAEVRLNYESDWATVTVVAAKLGIGTAETLRKWVLCRSRHNTHYADLPVMPIWWGWVGGCAWWRAV